MTTLAPIQTLAPENIDVTVLPNTYVGLKQGFNWGAFLLWFIIITAIVFFFLWLFKPSLLQSTTVGGVPTGQPDVWKTLLGAIIVALIIMALIYLVRGCK